MTWSECLAGITLMVCAIVWSGVIMLAFGVGDVALTLALVAVSLAAVGSYAAADTILTRSRSTERKS